jgi:hypothetical protein
MRMFYRVVLLCDVKTGTRQVNKNNKRVQQLTVFCELDSGITSKYSWLLLQGSKVQRLPQRAIRKLN